MPTVLIGRLRLLVAVLAAGLAALAVLVSVSGPASARTEVRNQSELQCIDRYPAQRDPANPLMLSAAPGSNPLAGARFFVDGPAHGSAAGAIARLLGIDSSTPTGSVLRSIPESESWAQFSGSWLVRTAEASQAGAGPQIQLLSKIAAQPEVQRVSSYSQGGGPGAIYNQTQKLFCHNFTADPGAIPIINTYFLHPDLGGCATPAQIDAYMPTFRRRVNELVAATGNRPVVFLLELDAFGSSACMARQGDLTNWEAAVRYEVDQISNLPHAVTYIEAGYSDANSPAYTARALNNVDIGRIRGFYTNDTHENWTINEVHWAEKVSRLTHGANFIINTAQNGRGPLRNPHPSTQGVEDLCNPPRRGLGPLPTTNTGFPHADAFLWTSVPGNSSGPCNGGPPAGTFWAARAIELSANANGQLGPRYPSRPY